jgi:hypothetical protein
MRGLCLWEFLTCELPCLPPSSAPSQPVISKVTWLRWLLENFGVSISIPIPLLSDSTWAISITRNPVKHELTKHIGVDAHIT